MSFTRRLVKVIIDEGFKGVTWRLGTRVYLLYLKLARTSNRKMVKSRYGPTFKANYEDATFRFYIFGAYGFFYWNELKSFDKKFVFIDVGANQGLYSIGAAFNAQLSHVYAFEPVLKTVGLLNENIKLNDVQDKVTVVPKAISDKAGVTEIHIKDNHSGAATISKNNLLSGSESTEIIETLNTSQVGGGGGGS